VTQTEDDFRNNLVIQKLQENHDFILFLFPQERNPKTLNPKPTFIQNTVWFLGMKIQLNSN